jgi:NADPH-dependent 2,4-dienoyl-CoA reductase/sulfur reductase-like enzyme/rhodanese-related sulfurtransferase
MPSDTPRRIVIIGGVAAGMSAATRLRRRDERAEIIVLERTGHVSFANCGLPYYLGGTIGERGDLLLQTPERLASRFRLDVRVNSDVTAIDPAMQTVTVAAPVGITTLYYDELVLATGASPLRPDIPGSERMLALRSIEDTDRIHAELAALPAGSPVVIVGAGYIGLELAETLTHRGFAVTLVQRAPQVLGTLDIEMAGPVADYLRASGIDLRLDTTVTEVTPTSVALDDGTTVDTQVVISAIGVRPESDLARAAGIALGPDGGIRVDSQHRTSAPHVYAVGDVAHKVSAVDGSDRLVMLAGPANRDGRYLADAIAGDTVYSRPALGTAIIQLFGMTVASLGATERELRAAGRGIRVIHTHPASHATYYPGAEALSIKLIVDATTDLILGSQAVGASGVDKRIDVISTAMSAGLTASALADLELAYAPQYGSAKDPVNMLGYVARNLRDGLTRSIQWHELDAEMNAGSVLVDVRTPAEFAAGSIPGAVNMPLDDLRDRAGELDGHRVVVHCQVGQRGHTAARLLTQLGVDAVNLDGGYRTWLAGANTRQAENIGAL